MGPREKRQRLGPEWGRGFSLTSPFDAVRQNGQLLSKNVVRVELSIEQFPKNKWKELTNKIMNNLAS